MSKITYTDSHKGIHAEDFNCLVHSPQNSQTHFKSYESIRNKAIENIIILRLFKKDFDYISINLQGCKEKT